MSDLQDVYGYVRELGRQKLAFDPALASGTMAPKWEALVEEMLDQGWTEGVLSPLPQSA